MLAASWLVVSAALLAPQPAPRPCALPGLAESPRLPGVPFEELQRSADTAWDAARLPEALRYYRAGVELNPRWVAGLWRLGLLFWMADCDVEARDALRRLLDIAPDSAQGWALLGVAEYRLQEYDEALSHVRRGNELGLSNEAIALEAHRTLALLLLRNGDFAGASRVLGDLAREAPDDEEVLLACGLVALRMPRLPSQIGAAEEELVRTAGRAARAAFSARIDEAWRLFEELVARYPTTRGVHLAYGLVLSHQADPRARELLEKEVELFPDNVEAQTQLALENLVRGDPADALKPARAAVELAPEVGANQLALGRALLATGATEEAITALEEAARLDPGRAETFVALAQAYQEAGRTQDVERARRTLTELYSEREGAQ